MKNTIRLCGIAAFLLLIVLSFAACPNDTSSSGPNTAAKSLKITNIPAGTTLTECVVRAKQNQLFDEGICDAACVPPPETSGTTTTFALKMAGDSSKGWTGYGGYYIIITDGSTEKWYSDSTTGKKIKFDISSTVSTIDWAKFQ